jgi:hypothetical protein
VVKRSLEIAAGDGDNLLMLWLPALGDGYLEICGFKLFSSHTSLQPLYKISEVQRALANKGSRSNRISESRFKLADERTRRAV